MSAAVDKQAALLAIQIKATGVAVHIDDNPVARYAFFCRQYNSSCNIVDGKAYEVPDLTTKWYKRFRSTWFPFPSIKCDSVWCIPQVLYYALLIALLPLTIIAPLYFGISFDSYD